MKNLVIVESPAKAKTINKILGKDFTVRASMGHVRDLPQKEIGVDIEHGFKPKYVTIKSREKIIKELRIAAAAAEHIYLAPDPDREGEAIAWHLMAALKGKSDDGKFSRVTYNEITAPAIRKAFQEPRKIDQHKVDSQQARRVLDRIVGYQVSPLLWRRIRGATSAGRVQSVALRLVCEREREILNFKPEEYWILGAKVRKLVEPREPFDIRLAKVDGENADIKSADQAHAVRADLEGRPLRVSAIIRRDISRRAPPAFITSTLQQAASSRLGYAPKRTMQLAQRLYEGEDFGEGPVGLITYMRTDSVALSPVAIQAAREFIHSKYGPEYVPETPHFYKSKDSAQEAHEAIRPTDVHRTPESLAHRLEPDELRLYQLIWERFVACQTAPAKIAQRTAEIEATPTPGKKTTYLFRGSASEILFPGYMKVTGADQKKEDAQTEDGEPETTLPPLEEGESIEKVEWLEERKETQPPPRYTEASLIKALEEDGVGRPSTYAQTISTILDRKYVDRDKRQLKPTVIGFAVNDFLVQHLGELFDVKFTAGMEASLDEVENGSVQWTAMLKDFYKSFQGWIKQAKGKPADTRVVKGLLKLLETIQTWAPATQRGKRTYSDQKFVESVKEQLEKGEKPITDRQLDALKKMACRYKDQLPGLDELAEKLNIVESMQQHHVSLQPPTPEVIQKLQLLENVTYAEPRKVGKRTFDDKAFCDSLRGRVQSGQGLTVNQIRYLDRLVLKYSDQIPDFATLRHALGVDLSMPEGDQHVGPVLELVKQITEWKPPVQRGRRLWDDRAFYESLARQFGERKQLSFKQSAALKKLLRRYSAQIQDYDHLVESMGLLPRKKARAEGDTPAGQAASEP